MFPERADAGQGQDRAKEGVEGEKSKNVCEVEWERKMKSEKSS